MRCFISVPIIEDLKGKIEKIQERIDSAGADIKFVEKENLHFTIKFLGEISEEKLEKVKETIKKTANMFESFEINIKNLGCFPNRDYARVIWLSAENSVFPALIEAFDLNLNELGFEKEKSYIPHLTVGRVKSGSNKTELLAIIRELENIEVGLMKIDKIELFKSVLTPKGPIYEELLTVNLR